MNAHSPSELMDNLLRDIKDNIRKALALSEIEDVTLTLAIKFQRGEESTVISMSVHCQETINN